MVKYKNLHVLGTSHISKQSINEVRKAINSLKPSIIALELDKSRFLSLTSDKKPNKLNTLKSLGIRGFLFNFFGAFFEKMLGKQTGIKPGSEMKIAINLAKKNKIHIALIDQPIQITIRKLTSQITRKEIMTFMKEFLLVLFSKKEVKFDLKKVPSQKIIKKLMQETKSSYPTLHKILVKERNIYMAKNLGNLMKANPEKTILAIVGAGHEKEIVGELKSIMN